MLDSQANAQDEGQKADNGTTHSALPKRPAYDPSIPGRHIGILRLIVDEDSTPPQYMWRGHRLLYYPVGLTSSLLGEEQLATTMDRQEALLVCFLQSSEPHPIACLVRLYAWRVLQIHLIHRARILRAIWGIFPSPFGPAGPSLSAILLDADYRKLTGS